MNILKKRIKVLIVEDSPVAVLALKRMLATSDEIEVVGTARHGKEGLEMIPRLNPDVICTDLHMPVMDGLEFTKEIMARHPLPTLVVSVSVGESHTQNVFQLLQAGAIDVFPKPQGALIDQTGEFSAELVSKIKVLSGVIPFSKQKRQKAVAAGVFPPALHPAKAVSVSLTKDLRMIVIGASTGGPQALEVILKALPHDFPLPIVCVQHISDGFLESLVEWLAKACKVRVVIVKNNELPMPSTVYFAPDHKHVTFNSEGRFLLTDAPPVDGHRPSVTVTMASLAERYQRGAMAVLLTGMGRDGADGMLSVSRVGGTTIAQDKDSSIVFGMPEQAIRLGAAKYVLDIGAIAKVLVDFANKEKTVSLTKT
ncbi:chemotaxis-specific protein-glutamate methyltransferase CheB [Candidatus Magnetomonas plexicatena]|uniref:chemotaxis-specific protein-glutamate methyltransferase CheB n=1 Tax=Candidatus Magnetomonas plexicatena TaxID=2552947 RepID=UPI001C76D6E5|nr:chemotaxis-specific protein-glutamate methyltransferase CheB [Nitrospirales bacterium LBB_01]